MATYTVYHCNALTGGADRALDSYTCVNLNADSRALVSDATHGFLYFKFNASSTDAENVTTHPFKVRPDDYATLGAGVWEETPPTLAHVQGTDQGLDTGGSNAVTAADLKTLKDTTVPGKADKVSGATNGNFAGLDASGNLTDSTKKAADFDVAGAASGAISTHESSYTHSDIATNTSARHTQSHAITSTSDHTSSATSGKVLKADANGLPIDATNTDAEVSAAVTASHARSHALTSTDDHTVSGLTSGHFLKATGATTFAFGAHGLSASDVSAVALSLFNANTILSADTDNTPAAITISEQQVVGRITSGSIKGLSTTELTGLVTDASTTVKGKVELAIASEVNTGTSTTLAVTPDALAGSNLGTKHVGMVLFESDTDVAVGDGTAPITIPAEMNGMNLVNVIASVHTKGVTGTTDVQLRRRRAGSDVDMLSTKITIGDEYYATDETINTSNDDVATGDQIYIDVDAVHTTTPKGLSVTLSFRLP